MCGVCSHNFKKNNTNFKKIILLVFFKINFYTYHVIPFEIPGDTTWGHDPKSFPI